MDMLIGQSVLARLPLWFDVILLTASALVLASAWVSLIRAVQNRQSVCAAGWATVWTVCLLLVVATFFNHLWQAWPISGLWALTGLLSGVWAGTYFTVAFGPRRRVPPY